ncbi:MAG: DUF2254 domain-containing protein [Pseudomonadota bacterium]
MKTQLFALYYKASASFWLLPAAFSVAALLIAPLMLRLDEVVAVKSVVEQYGGPRLTVDGSRQILSTISGAMITVSSLILSMTLVALTMVAQQLGPRVIQMFLADSVAKITLGTFLASFIFSMLTLGATGTGANGDFVPLLTTYTSVALALAAFGLMIHFIHHIATSIQADVVVTRLGDDLNAAIENERNRGDECRKWLSDDEIADERNILSAHQKEITAARSGYVEAIDEGEMLNAAKDSDAQITLLCRPGHFVLSGHVIASVSGQNRDVAKDLPDHIQSAIAIGSTRTRLQQVEFELNAMVEVALRALSPGINDPFTAMTCIDRLSDALSRLAQYEKLNRALYDGTGTPRVLFYPTPFSHYMDTAFHPIRQYGASDTGVLLQLLTALEALCVSAHNEGHRRSISQHANLVLQSAETSKLVRSDVSKVRSRVLDIQKRVLELGEGGKQ